VQKSQQQSEIVNSEEPPATNKPEFQLVELDVNGPLYLVKCTDGSFKWMVLNRKSRNNLVECLDPTAQGTMRCQGNYIKYNSITDSAENNN